MERGKYSIGDVVNSSAEHNQQFGELSDMKELINRIAEGQLQPAAIEKFYLKK